MTDRNTSEAQPPIRTDRPKRTPRVRRIARAVVPTVWVVKGA